jgi:hypothetical protein
MKASGFWTKILVDDKTWTIMFTQIQDNSILEKALGVDGFWSKIVVDEIKWNIILEYLQDL